MQTHSRFEPTTSLALSTTTNRKYLPNHSTHSIPKTANPAPISPPATGTAIGAAAPVLADPGAVVVIWLTAEDTSLATDEMPLDTAESMTEMTEEPSVVRLLTTDVTSLLVTMLLTADVTSLTSESMTDVPAARMELMFRVSTVVVVWALALAAARNVRRKVCGFIFVDDMLKIYNRKVMIKVRWF